MTKKTDQTMPLTASKRITSKDVFARFREHISFTTGDVVESFKITSGRAAAFLAILRLQEKLHPSPGKGHDGTSLWIPAK